MRGGPGSTGTGIDPAALVHVESLQLAQTVILHNRASGAIVASNAFGAMLIDQLRARPDPADAIREIAADLEMAERELRPAVGEILARWVEDGLFLTAMRPFPVPVRYRRAEGAQDRHFTLGTRAVVLRTEDPALRDDIDRALAPMGLGAARPGAQAVPVRLDVIRAAEGYGVFRDGAPVWGASGYELTRFHLLREIMDALSGPERVAAHLHASALAIGGAGLVFAGASGSGKSTLATLLLGTGAALVADDHVALDITGETIFAFPTRPNLKPGAEALPAVAAVVAAHGEGSGDFVPKARVAAGTPVRFAGLVLPQYDAHGGNALEEVAPDEALRVLIQTGSRVSRSTRSIAPLVHALAAHPVRRLCYRDNDFALAACRSLVGL